MLELIHYQDLVSREIDDFQRENKDMSLYFPVNYIMDIGGKRLRPVLTLLGCEVFNGQIEKVLKPALGIEVFHNFTLLHDDIMDAAPLRRGKSTVHQKWGQNAAILSGDVMFVQAFTLVTSCEDKYLRDVLDLFNVTAIEVCEGQQMDMDFEKRDDVTIAEYIEMIKLKTSVLVGCALKLGAIIADAPKNEAQLLYDFGLNLGIAFQIKDDLLDVFGDADLFGKQVGGDILANKKTYLMLKAGEVATGDVAVRLKSAMKIEGATEKVKEVTAIFNELKIENLATEMMDLYYEKAITSLEAMRIDVSKKDYLKSFADSLMNRAY